MTLETFEKTKRTKDHLHCQSRLRASRRAKVLEKRHHLKSLRLLSSEKHERNPNRRNQSKTSVTCRLIDLVKVKQLKSRKLNAQACAHVLTNGA